MERYKSTVRSVVVNGARHAFLLADGQTWVSVFLKKDQRPEFQQAIRNVAQGQEYTFDCTRNNRGFLNIDSIQHVSWPTAVAAKDPAMAPAVPGGAAPPMPTAQTVTQQPTLQPVIVQAPGQAVAAPPLPSPPVVIQPPAAATPAPAQPATVEISPPPTPPITEITESSELPLKERLIARENAATCATQILCAILEKGNLPEELEPFITWIQQKFVQLQDAIAENTLKTDDVIPF